MVNKLPTLLSHRRSTNIIAEGQIGKKNGEKLSPGLLVRKIALKDGCAATSFTSNYQHIKKVKGN